MRLNFGTLSVEPLVQEAVAIVENLVDNDAFFLHTFGSVLRQIAGESKIVKSSITDEEILQIRTKLQCTVSYDMQPPEKSYMECDLSSTDAESNIIMNPSVRSHFIDKVFLVNLRCVYFSGWDVLSKRSRQ